MTKNLIVAIADNNAIGKNNSLLWHISEDLKFFKRTTVGSPIIMGRKTFESIGRPLPKRLNIVISRNMLPVDGIVAVKSLEEAFARAQEEGCEQCFVMGGGQIYSQALGSVDRLYVTHVHTVIPDADTFFPQIDSSQWKVSERSEMMTDPETGYNFEFVIYDRIS